MSLRHKVFASLAALAGFFAAGAPLAAQEMMEVSTTSYMDLLRRVELLENSNSSGAIYSASSSDSSCGCSNCCDCGRFFAKYDAVIVQPYLSNNSAFVAENDPNLEHVGFDWDLKYSTRIDLGYMAPTGALGWRARWWHFDQDSSFFADDANGLIPDDEAEVFYALDVRIEDIDSGTFIHDMRMDVVDLELTKQLGHNVSLSFGGRLVDSSQEFFATTDEGDAFSSLDFTAAGPSLGLRLDHYITRNWTVFASARGSMLFGDKTFYANTDDADLAIRIDNDYSLTYSTDLEIGTMLRRGNWFMTMALEAQYWSNFGSALPNHIAADDGADDYEGDGYNPMNVDLGFFGFSAGIGVDY